MMDNIVDDLIEDATYRHLSTAITLTGAGLRMLGQSRSIAPFFKSVVHLLFSVLGQARRCLPTVRRRRTLQCCGHTQGTCFRSSPVWALSAYFWNLPLKTICLRCINAGYARWKIRCCFSSQGIREAIRKIKGSKKIRTRADGAPSRRLRVLAFPLVLMKREYMGRCRSSLRVTCELLLVQGIAQSYGTASSSLNSWQADGRSVEASAAFYQPPLFSEDHISSRKVITHQLNHLISQTVVWDLR